MEWGRHCPAIAQPCPKLLTLHRFALTLRFHNRFASLTGPATPLPALNTFPRSSKFAFLIFCFVSAQFISLAPLTISSSLSSLVCNFSATHKKRGSKTQQIIILLKKKKNIFERLYNILLDCLSTRFHGLSLQLRRSIAIDVASTGNGSEISHRDL